MDASDAAKIAAVAPHRPGPNPANADARYPPLPPVAPVYFDPAALLGFNDNNALFAARNGGVGLGGGAGTNCATGVAAAMNLAGGGGNQMGGGAQAGPAPRTEAQRRARAAEAAARRAEEAAREARRKRARGG